MTLLQKPFATENTERTERKCKIRKNSVSVVPYPEKKLRVLCAFCDESAFLQ